MSASYPASRRPDAGRAHALTGPTDGLWGCSLCDWTAPASWAVTRSSAAREFARDDRHAAARPVVDALEAQQQSHDALAQLVPQASREGAQRVALAGVLERWQKGRPPAWADYDDADLNAEVRAAWPALAAALDTLVQVHR